MSKKSHNPKAARPRRRRSAPGKRRVAQRTGSPAATVSQATAPQVIVGIGASAGGLKAVSAVLLIPTDVDRSIGHVTLCSGRGRFQRETAHQTAWCC